MTLPFGDRSFDGLISFYAVTHVLRNEIVSDPMGHGHHPFALVSAH